AIQHEIDVNTLEQKQGSSSLELNSIALVDVDLTEDATFDIYGDLPHTGAFAVIDRLSNVTVGAGMVFLKKAEPKQDSKIKNYTKAETQLNKYIRDNYPEWNCIKI